LGVDYVCYLGDGPHRNVPYNAMDPNVMKREIEEMQGLGIDFIRLTNQGHLATACEFVAVTMTKLCEQMGMKVMLLLDPWDGKLGNPNDPTGDVINDLNSSHTQSILNSSAYIPEKYVCLFDHLGADPLKLAATFKNLTFLSQHTQFSWISIPGNTPIDSQRNAASIADLAKQHSSPGMKVASLCGSFDDTGKRNPDGSYDNSQSAWGGRPRVLDGELGQFLFKQYATIPPTIKYISIVTWNDPEERTTGPMVKTVSQFRGVNWLKP
jgi:hypothetical protein